VSGHVSDRLPGHASFVFEDVEIAPVLLGLDRYDIWASSGSACTSASSEPSHVLLAMGIGREWVFGALRLTFGLDNSPADVDALLETIPPLVVGARRKVMAAV
jgi:cysteine desulfurase